MKEIVEKMKAKGFLFDTGLSDQEISEIEKRYGIKFPKSLISFYQEGLLIGCESLHGISGEHLKSDFMNWRDTSRENVKAIKAWIRWPFESIFWDIENGQFWVHGWDEPKNFDEKKARFMEEMKNEPRPIPIFGHRCILAKEGADDPPVLSMYGSDIIIFGNNLKDYLAYEFLEEKRSNPVFDRSCLGKWADVMRGC